MNKNQIMRKINKRNTYNTLEQIILQIIQITQIVQQMYSKIYKYTTNYSPTSK